MDLDASTGGVILRRDIKTRGTPTASTTPVEFEAGRDYFPEYSSLRCLHEALTAELCDAVRDINALLSIGARLQMLRKVLHSDVAHAEAARERAESTVPTAQEYASTLHALPVDSRASPLLNDQDRQHS